MARARGTDGSLLGSLPWTLLALGVVGPVRKIQGMGLLLGLVCDRPAAEVRDALLEHDILTGTSADPEVLRILAPLVLQGKHVNHLAQALANIVPATD